MNILLIALISLPVIFPTNSYEMGHYAPPFIANTITQQAVDLTIDWVKPDMVWGSKMILKTVFGIVGGGLSIYILSKHYQTPEEITWGGVGNGHASILNFTIGFIRLPIDKRNKEKERKATIEKWLQEQVTIEYGAEEIENE
jgi:cystathionine beta-lyase family protein involved in aluminum resistance